MKKLENFIGPGTAGIAMRIPSMNNDYELATKDIKYLSVVKYNKVMACSQNQF